jgi:hypothetical protein
VYATKPGTKAREHPAKGGYFTNALLDASLGIKVQQGHQAIVIENLISRVPAILRLQGNNQIPEILKVSGDLQVPFALSFSAQNQPAAYLVRMPISNNSEWVGAAVGLFLLFAIAMGGSK